MAQFKHIQVQFLPEKESVFEKLVRQELSIVGVPVVTVPFGIEKFSTLRIGGCLNDFRFFRVTNCWVVRGRFPVSFAIEVVQSIDPQDLCAPIGLGRVNRDGFVADGLTTQERIDEKYLFVSPKDFPNFGDLVVTSYYAHTEKGFSFLLQTMRKHRLV